jgi:hypothetical protein
MMPDLKAGLAYFAIVFAAGIVLGLLRVLLVVPELGITAGLLIELPLMLVLSWLACRWCVERFEVSDRAMGRFVMGGVAFGLLMIAELGASVVAFGRNPEEHLATFEQDSALPGLVAQLVFAAMPLIQLWWANRSAATHSA